MDLIDLKITNGIGLIKLKQTPTPIEMQEVVIKSLKPMIEMHIDRQVLNMDRITGSNNGTLTEVLRNSGVVEADPQSNNISVGDHNV